MQHRPKRSLGQNFLRDNSIIDRIIAAVDIHPDEQIIEIGPGQGALTERLVASGAKITAIEFDRDLAPRLAERFRDEGKFHVLEADALDLDFSQIGTPPSKLVANLPYNISTPILQRLIEQREVFSTLVLMFQREVVERITAEAGSRDRGFLSVVAQNAFDIQYLFDVSPNAFHPVPKVWSAVVRMEPRPRLASETKLRELVSHAFAQKRKTLANNLRGTIADPAATIAAAGLPDKVRAEQLTLPDWYRLLANLR